MWALQSARAVIEAMPQSARVGALGGPLAASQLPEADRSGLLLAAVLSKSGSDGSALYEVIKAAAFVAGYEAARQLDEPEFRAFPMSQALEALLIRGEHERATEAGAGSRDGATVGHSMRTRLKYMRAMGWPLEDLDCPVVDGAAPHAKAGGGRRSTAATLPLVLILHAERLAAASLDQIVAWYAEAGQRRSHEGAFVLRFLARSLVCAEATSARMQDAIRMRLFPDEVDPRRYLRGSSHLAKDGEPIALHAPAEGLLGPFQWLGEHLDDIASKAGGNAFPAWEGPHGSKKDPSKAARLVPEVAGKDAARGAVFAVWGAPPLSLSEEARKLVGVTCHSVHGSWSDAARAIGEFPRVPFALDPDLVRGFSRHEGRVLGHWRRDKNAEAPGPPRLGAGPARPPGAQDEHGAMEDAYSRGEGRLGERAEQLRARARLTSFLRLALAHMEQSTPWPSLPADASGWSSLLPSLVE